METSSNPEPSKELKAELDSMSCPCCKVASTLKSPAEVKAWFESVQRAIEEGKAKATK